MEMFKMLEYVIQRTKEFLDEMPKEKKEKDRAVFYVKRNSYFYGKFI